MDVLTREAREAYLYARNLTASRARDAARRRLRAGLQERPGLERQFVAAGGLLLAGPDPTGNGGVIPGFGDQREVELLVEAGFTPVEAIRIATLNGATYLGLADRIGSIAPGKDADLVVVKGDPHRTSPTSRTSRSCSRTASATTRKLIAVGEGAVRPVLTSSLARG